MTTQDGGVANSDGQNTADLNTNGQNNAQDGGDGNDKIYGGNGNDLIVGNNAYEVNYNFAEEINTFNIIDDLKSYIDKSGKALSDTLNTAGYDTAFEAFTGGDGNISELIQCYSVNA